MNKILRKEILIGILVIVAAAILFFGINFLKGVNLFKASNYFYATYANVEGLTQSAPVTLNGYKIGIVREIRYDYAHPGNVTVEFSVDKELRLPRGSVATVGADVLGTASIALTLGDAADGYYSIGDTIPSEYKAGLVDALSKDLMPSVSSIFPKIDTLLTNINVLVADPALAKSIGRLDDITAELDQSVRSLHAVMASLAPTARDIKGITENVDTITGDLAAVSARLRYVPVDSIMQQLQATADNLHTLTDNLNNPNSTLGHLTRDDELYQNLNSTVASLDSVLVDFKKNPRRYINLRIF